ncbi:MAG: hypothetical protein FWG77_07705 [Treponema sp.]|nr:hypothetical protein [Treponema sp.]
MKKSFDFIRVTLKIKFILFALLFSLIFSSCDWEGWTLENLFESNLQGTWVTNDPESIYSGSLIIRRDSITITGYGESQTPSRGGNDEERPFKNITRGLALEGYSERSFGSSNEGYIYINDKGRLQEGIHYNYWTAREQPGNIVVHLLTFSFSGRIQTLRRTEGFSY